ncbi:MAG: hypothetical protein HY303_14205 [Candidatus Wallbacteria bacterium]|nr:hypothetical protein [Candidatus Wallbacteria bacterium]
MIGKFDVEKLGRTLSLALALAAMVLAAPQVGAQPRSPRPPADGDGQGQPPRGPEAGGDRQQEPPASPPSGDLPPPPRGGPPPLDREQPFGPQANAPLPPPPPRDGPRGQQRPPLQVYFLKPKVTDRHQLFELAKILEKLGMGRPPQVDEASGNLIVQCEPEHIAEIERVVTTLSEERQKSADKTPRQVTLEVRVFLASPSAGGTAAAGLDPKVIERMTQVFGYKSIRLLGTQLVRVRLGEHASSETFFKDPGSERVFPFSLGFAIDQDGDDLRIRAALKALDQGAVITTTFLSRPDHGTVLGNSSLNAPRKGSLLPFTPFGA